MDNELFNSSQMEGFGQEGQDYSNIINTIVTSTVDFIDKKSISIDTEQLKARISTLKIIRRDGVNNEYVPDSNTLYLSRCNQRGEIYSDEQMVITTAHELMHVISSPDIIDNFSNRFYGFDEFFTEYMAFVAIMRVGGINLESYYKQEIKGYFGNSNDNNFIRKLSEKVGFENLLRAYINRDQEGIEQLVGPEILASLNEYYQYYFDLYELIGQPLKKLNEMLENPILSPQKKVIDSHVAKISQQI